MTKYRSFICILLLSVLHSCMMDIDDFIFDDKSFGIIQGSVTDNDGNPLEKIRITIEVNDGNKPETYYTTSEGMFRCEFATDGNDGDGQIILGIILDDIDGEKNGGLFESKSDVITIFKEEFKKSPITIDLPTYRLSHAIASENNPQF